MRTLPRDNVGRKAPKGSGFSGRVDWNDVWDWDKDLINNHKTHIAGILASSDQGTEIREVFEFLRAKAIPHDSFRNQNRRGGGMSSQDRNSVGSLIGYLKNKNMITEKLAGQLVDEMNSRPPIGQGGCGEIVAISEGFSETQLASLSKAGGELLELMPWQKETVKIKSVARFTGMSIAMSMTYEGENGKGRTAQLYLQGDQLFYKTVFQVVKGL